MHLSASPSLPPQLPVAQALFRFRYSRLDTTALLLVLQLSKFGTERINTLVRVKGCNDHLRI